MPAEYRAFPFSLPVLWLSALALAACAKTTEPLPSARMTLEPYLAPCQMEASMSCMVVGESDIGQPGLLYGQIEGFRFEWGYRQTLQVDRRRILHPDADAPNIEYTLVKTLEKASSPDWSFRASFHGSDMRLNGDTLSIRGYPRPILVEAQEDGEMLKGKAGGYLNIRVRPRPGEAGSGPLQGDSVRVLP